MHKRGTALILSLVVTSNVLPLNTITAYGEELNKETYNLEQQVEKTQEEEKEEIKEEQSELPKEEEKPGLPKDEVEQSKPEPPKEDVEEVKPELPKEEVIEEVKPELPKDEVQEEEIKEEIVKEEKQAKKTTIEYGNLKVVYDGNNKTVPYKIIDEDGNEVKGGTVKLQQKLIGNLYIDFNPKNVGTYEFSSNNGGKYKFSIDFKGDEKYQKPILENFTLEIEKCKPNVKVGNTVVEYNGNKVRTPVDVQYGCGYINIYTGANINLSTLVNIDLNLGDDLVGKAISAIFNSLGRVTVGELKNQLKANEGLLSGLGMDVNDIIKALDYIPSSQIIEFGAPKASGGYVSTVVVLDQNAEVKIGVGSLLIYRKQEQVVFTENSLPDKSVVKVDYNDEYDYIHEAKYKDSNSSTKMIYTGLTAKGKVYGPTKDKPTEEGTYIATAYAYNDPNYQVGLAMRTFSISKFTTKSEITSQTTKKYDGNPYEAQIVVKDKNGEEVKNPNVKYTYYKGLKKLDKAPTEIGKYKVVATFTGDKAHIGSIASKNFEITKGDLVVKVHNQEKTYGQEDPKLEYSIEGIVGDDVVEFDTYREEGENVGTYNIKVKDTELAKDNYTVEEGSLTINKANLKVTVDNQSKVYGEEDPKLTYNVEGIVGEETVEFETYREEGENVGTYAINVRETELSNYNYEVIPGNLTINKAHLKVTVDNQSKVYGEEDPELTYSVEGIVGEDILEFNPYRAEGEAIGEYKIDIEEQELENYNYTVNTGVFKINPSEIDDSNDSNKPDDSDDSNGSNGPSDSNNSNNSNGSNNSNKPNKPNKPGNTNNPQTSDTGILRYAGIGVASLIGLFASRKKKTNK